MTDEGRDVRHVTSRDSEAVRRDGERRIGIGVIGCGYWGPHLIRNLHALTDAEVLGVADRRPDRLEYVGRS